MTNEIMNRYKIYNENQHYIDKSFINDFIKDYIKANGLENYLNVVTFDSNYKTIAIYTREFKKININLKKLLESIIRTLGINEIDEYNIVDINNSILATVLHELTHVEQTKNLIEKNLDKRIEDIIKESFKIRTCNSNKNSDFQGLYTKHHDLFIIEYNANINGMFKMIELANNLDNINKKVYAKVVHDFLMTSFVYDELGVMSPLEKFNILKNNYQTQDIYDDISEEEKILYGLPINSETYQKIWDLRKEKSIEPYKYFKH